MLPPYDVPLRTLRQYALLADGERGALVDPEGDIAFLCAPRWHDDAVFSSLLGGGGRYSVTPCDPRHVWGGHYEQGSLVWRSRWVTTRSVIESAEALAFPGEVDRLVLLRRVEARRGLASVHLELECRARFGQEPVEVERHEDGVWEGRTGDLRFRWTGAPAHTALRNGRLCADLALPEGGHHDLVLEITRGSLPDRPPDPERTWKSTRQHWASTRPSVSGSAAPGDSLHSWAVLRGLTSAEGGMVAAATTSLPERAELGRDYDYRYAWIRDQCLAGQAALSVGAEELLDTSVGFVRERVLADGPHLRPAYTVAGGALPEQSSVPVPGYPGAPTCVGNRAGSQFQLDVFGESLLLLAGADGRGRLDGQGWAAVEVLTRAIRDRAGEPDAGMWEIDDRHWAHSRLICAAGLRAAARRVQHRRAPSATTIARRWEQLADGLVADVDRDCLHPSGRWQRSPGDPDVDAALLLPGLRGAVPPTDERVRRTVAAVRDSLADDGYVYRFRHSDSPSLHAAEGAFLLSGFHLALAELSLGRPAEAVRWFERNRGAQGPPGLFTEEFDVVQRELRGNLPQAFVHAAALEAAQRLGEAGVDSTGFAADDR